MDRPGVVGRTAAICVPSPYHVAMSNLALHRLLELLGDQPGWTGLRAFLPSTETAGELIRRGERLRTFDREVRLDQVDLWLVSVAYEEEYESLCRMLELAGLPRQARDREVDQPLIVVGGFAPTLNPEPIAEIADVVLLGPAELTLDPLLRRWSSLLDRHGRRGLERGVLGDALAELPGCYVTADGPPEALVVPGTTADWDPDGEARLRVDRSRAGNPPRTRILTPHTEFADRFVVAVGEGCPTGCRFCAASFARRPPRAWPATALAAAVDQGLAATPRIGLLGAAVSDLPSLGSLAAQVEGAGGELSTSSLRVGTRLKGRPPLVGRTATIAPEAATAAARCAINKPLSDDEIDAMFAACVEAGAVRVRAYLLLGLPGGDDGEVDALIDLVERGRRAMTVAGRGSGRPTELVLSVNAFVPKPDTPLQWAAMVRPRVLEARARALGAALGRRGGVRLLWGGARGALRQALLSTGDRDVCEWMAPGEGVGRGNLRSWHRARGDYLFEDRSRDQFLPWGFVDRGVSRGFLWREWRRTRRGEPTPPCDVLTCRACGACGG